MKSEISPSVDSSVSNKGIWHEARALLWLAAPLIVSQFAQMGMNFTDTVMAGRHAEASLAGVAIGSSLWVPCFLLLVGILMATTPIIAQAWGAGNKADINHSVQQAMWLALVTGLLMLVVLQALVAVFDQIQMEVQTREQARGYVIAVSTGLPALAFFQVLRGLNEGAHLTRTYMYVSIVAVIINVPLNYIFIYGKLGLPEMGGAGCGWATSLVLWLELLMMLLLSIKHPALAAVRWYTGWRLPEREKILELLKLGLPIGIALLIESSMFALIALFLAGEGATVVAGHQVAMSVISLLFMVPLSLSMAMTIRCGYCLGKAQPQRARYIGFIGIVFTLCAAAFFSLLMLLAAEPIASLYTTSDEVKSLAVQLLFLAAIFQFSDAVQVSAAGALRGYKDTRFAFIVVLIAYWGVGLPLGYSLGLTELWGVRQGAQGFWVGLIAGLGLASVLLAGRYNYVSRRAIRLKE